MVMRVFSDVVASVQRPQNPGAEPNSTRNRVSRGISKLKLCLASIEPKLYLQPSTYPPNNLFLKTLTKVHFYCLFF